MFLIAHFWSFPEVFHHSTFLLLSTLDYFAWTTPVCIACSTVESQEGPPLRCLATRVIPIIFANIFLLGINAFHPQHSYEI